MSRLCLSSLGVFRALRFSFLVYLILIEFSSCSSLWTHLNDDDDVVVVDAVK